MTKNRRILNRTVTTIKQQKEMKTPMQEMLEWVRETLPMDLETPQMIERKIESMIDVEKDTFIDFGDRISYLNYGDEGDSNLVWYEMFSTNEK